MYAVGKSEQGKTLFWDIPGFQTPLFLFLHKKPTSKMDSITDSFIQDTGLI